MAKLRVLQVSKSTGGVGNYMRLLVNNLDKNHFEVTVVCLSDGSESLAAELAQVNGVNALNLQMERYKINPLGDARVWLSLRQLIRQENFDLIHAHTSKPGFLTRTASFGTGIPTLYRPAGFAFHDGIAHWKSQIYAAVERFVARYFTKRIITVCNDERELAKRYRVGSDEQLVTIYTGIDLAQFNGQYDCRQTRQSLGVPENAFLFGTVGRLSKQKAPVDFVRAAALLHKKQPDAHLVWVGDGELRTETETLVHSLGLNDVFHFAGLRRDIPAVLNALDCFVLASHWEGFSISVLEAMAAKLPIVMNLVSGASEAVVNEETGLLVSIGDVNALAQALESIVSNPQKAIMMGKAGRLRAEKLFDQVRMISEVQNLYDEVYQDSLKKKKMSHVY